MEHKEALQKCTVEGNVIKLPNVQLDRKEYLRLKKELELIGGKWKGHKTQGFVFQSDPTKLLQEISNGNGDTKKQYQFFATPPELADKLVELADVKPEHIILEPSAGQGALIEAMIRYGHPSMNIFAVELMKVNSIVLNEKGFHHELGDFLKIPESLNYYDRIIANPPFAKNQDIDHVERMYELLKPGGRIVSIMSPHWTFASNKKETAFREWIEEVDAEVIKIEKGVFKDSGTMVNSVIVIIDKELS